MELPRTAPKGTISKRCPCSAPSVKRTRCAHPKDLRREARTPATEERQVGRGEAPESRCAQPLAPSLGSPQSSWIPCQVSSVR